MRVLAAGRAGRQLGIYAVRSTSVTPTLAHLGESTVRALQHNLSPEAEYVLDWFHVTMKLTVLDQYAQGVRHYDHEIGERLRDQVERLKWSLWQEHLEKALGKIEDIASSMAPLEETASQVKSLRKPDLQLKEEPQAA